MNHADIIMSMTLSALDPDEDTARWFADELGVEPCEFVRAEGESIVVKWLGRKLWVDARRVFCNPTDAQIEHEILADKAESRVSG